MRWADPRPRRLQPEVRGPDSYAAGRSIGDPGGGSLVAVGGRRAAAVLLVLLLAVLVEWKGARGDDWIPRTLDPLLHGSAPSHRPARAPRPKDRPQATTTTTVPASPVREPSAPGEVPSPEPVRPTESAEPTPATQAGAAEASGDGEPSAHPLAWK